MSRRQKVEDLYERVTGIADPDTFQLVIQTEADLYVLADLRKRFWDGTGEKPWQVIEINRHITAEREKRGSRDKNRWELDPASSEDYADRTSNQE